MQRDLFPDVVRLIQELDLNNIPASRKALLLNVSDYIRSQLSKGEPIQLEFICTHNSRRSVLAQFWALVMATYHDIPDVQTYSAGTEATRVFPKIVEVLGRSGAAIHQTGEEDNPQYFLKIGNHLTPIQAFSRTWQHPDNPSKDFAAIMVCSDAEENCPFIPGCDVRIGLPYDDPKISDGTDQQDKVYWERNLEIATEMKFIFSNL